MSAIPLESVSSADAKRRRRMRIRPKFSVVAQVIGQLLGVLSGFDHNKAIHFAMACSILNEIPHFFAHNRDAHGTKFYFSCRSKRDDPLFPQVSADLTVCALIITQQSLDFF